MLKLVPINEGTYENVLNCKGDTYVDNTDTDKYHTQEHEPESRYSVDMSFFLKIHRIANHKEGIPFQRSFKD